MEALTLYYEFLENEGDFVEYATDCIHENLVFMLQNADETTKKEVAKIVTNIKEKSRFMVSFQPQVKLILLHYKIKVVTFFFRLITLIVILFMKQLYSMICFIKTTTIVDH